MTTEQQQQQQQPMAAAEAAAASSRSPFGKAYNKANEEVAGSTAAKSIDNNNSHHQEENNSNSSSIMLKQNQQQAAAAFTLPSLHANTGSATATQNESSATTTAALAAPPPRVWEYPSGVPLPNKALLRSLYQAAMNDDDNDDDEKNGSGHGGAGGDQKELSDLGLLSMEQVLLPAMAYQEERALKRIQAVVQRDAPDNVPQLLAARKAVYDATRAAVRACHLNRVQHRLPQQAAQKAAWLEQERLEQQKVKQQQAVERAQQQDMRKQAREKRYQERKDKHPVNQELWREVAYLMTEMHHLEKEERLWKDAALSLSQQQEEEEQKLALQEQEQAKMKAATANEQHKDDAMDVDEDDNNKKAGAPTTTTTPELTEMLETIESITVSSERVERSLQRVSEMMEQSDKLRSDIFRRHQAERFRGYPGEREPKDLIRLLSQEQSQQE